jgi:MFS transporter, PPP family, 3-phenylpropionic acid transporter
MVHRAWIFSAYYGALYSPIAVWISFFPLWLRGKGLTEPEVGLCLSLGSLVSILSDPIVGGLADRSGRRKDLLLGLIIASALASLLNFVAEGFALLLFAFLMTTLFS